MLNNYFLLKQNIWPARGDKTQDIKKTLTCQDVAKRVLEGKPEHLEAYKTQKERKSYRILVKNQIFQMEKRWREAVKMLEVTGAGLNQETNIWEDERGDRL